MAYIDKDKALNLDFRINVSLFESRRKTAERAVQAYADAINAIPAADVRPVVRGKWIVSRTDYGWNCAEYPTHCKCTVCGREVPYQDKDNYCPNCGADMRETDDEKA